jgi:large subunit ribosomal protein L10
MKREEKTAVVEKLTEELKGADAIFAIDYRGISVPQAAELRTGLREAGTSFRVVKNRLTLRAADAAGTEDIKDFLTGPTALALVDGDVAMAAKTLTKLGGEWELLEYKGGIMGDAVLEPDQFKAIAKLPGRDQLNAQFAGVVASPLTGLVRGLGSMISGLASQLQQMADQGLVSGEAPAPPAEEAPAADASAAEGESSDEPSGDSASPAEASQPDTPAGEAEDVAGDGEAGSQEASAETSEPDPAPTDSPEEEPSEEQAPEGESADLDAGDSGTGEGDQDLGEEPGEDAEQTEPPSEENAGDETSDETSSEEELEKKEEGD